MADEEPRTHRANIAGDLSTADNQNAQTTTSKTRVFCRGIKSAGLLTETAFTNFRAIDAVNASDLGSNHRCADFKTKSKKHRKIYYKTISDNIVFYLQKFFKFSFTLY